MEYILYIVLSQNPTGLQRFPSKEECAKAAMVLATENKGTRYRCETAPRKYLYDPVKDKIIY